MRGGLYLKEVLNKVISPKFVLLIKFKYMNSCIVSTVSIRKDLTLAKPL